MFKLNLKIALRNLWKHKLVTAINIGGLSIALAAFLLVSLYVEYETSYDASLPGRERIFQVCRQLPDRVTPYMPPGFADAVKQTVPGVEAVGVVKKGGFDFAVTKADRTYFTSNYTLIDFEAAQLFNLKPQGGLQKPEGAFTGLFYLPDAAMRLLFPDKKDGKPEMVILGSKSAGFTAPVTGASHADPHSVLQYDALSIQNKLGAGEGYANNNYFTYIRLKPGTDSKQAAIQLTKLYREELAAAGQPAEKLAGAKTAIVLDPLANVHLRPVYGNNAAFKTVVALFVLGFVMLLIAGVNFTNLSIAQAAGRAKEVGVRKVMGAARGNLALQFTLEIFLQCAVAAALALVAAELLLPKFNAVFQVPLAMTGNGMIWKFPLVIVFLALVAGAYPAAVLSGFRPASVLKGNFQTTRETTWLRKALLVFQFAAAVVFIATLLVVNAQLDYMRREDKGFKPDQVVTISNMNIYNSPKKFAALRAQLTRIPGISSVTVASDLPDGSKASTSSYTAGGREARIGFVDVDFDYFATLSVPIRSGRSFQTAFPADTLAAAVLNEAAVAKFALKQPVGSTIRGCDQTYRVVGVAGNFKAQGFENAVEPAVFLMSNPCGNAKTRLMLKIEEQHMAAVLATLKKQWPELNKGDGDHFRYQFLDAVYGKLFQKQEQLQQVFAAAASLTVLIALMGLFAYARYLMVIKNREIAVRRVLGAGGLQLMGLLNAGFVKLVVISNLLAWPLVYAMTQTWLNDFAYRIPVPLYPFVAAGSLTLLLSLATVSLQAWIAIRKNPVTALKYE